MPRQGASTVHKATRPNLNESFFINDDRGPDHPAVRAGITLRGHWPATMPDLPGHDGVFPRHVRSVSSHAAGLRGGSRHVHDGTCTHRCARTVCATALRRVVSVLINLGNIMRPWSNDRFLSTPHRVPNESGTDRYSIAFFYGPDPESVIECLPAPPTPAIHRVTGGSCIAT
jgi:hypothetical protein